VYILECKICKFHMELSVAKCCLQEIFQLTFVHGATQKFGEFDHKKKFITVTPSFHHLL